MFIRTLEVQNLHFKYEENCVLHGSKSKTNIAEQSPSGKLSSHSASQEIPHLFPT
jgi:hypothetical protein